MAEEPTSDQLRGDIDAGRTGDKLAGFDPAAAPLGTDDEAAGRRPSAARVAEARATERSAPPDPAPNASTPELQPDARLKSRRPYVLAAFAGVLVAAVIAFGLGSGLGLW
jgi:hypothetical protein